MSPHPRRIRFKRLCLAVPILLGGLYGWSLVLQVQRVLIGEVWSSWLYAMMFLFTSVPAVALAWALDPL